MANCCVNGTAANGNADGFYFENDNVVIRLGHKQEEVVQCEGHGGKTKHSYGGLCVGGVNIGTVGAHLAYWLALFQKRVFLFPVNPQYCPCNDCFWPVFHFHKPRHFWSLNSTTLGQAVLFMWFVQLLFYSLKVQY